MNKNKKEKLYKITSLSKDDIRSLYAKSNKVNKIINKLTDTEMEYLARRLADDYINQLYWYSLESIFEDLFVNKK